MPISDLPVVPGSGPLGHVHLFRDERMSFLRSAAATGALSRVRFMHRWIVVVSSPEHAHEVLVERASSFEKSPALRVVLHDLAGDGLFTSEGETWRRQRRLMSPLFHPSQLSSYAGVMNEVARSALRRMKDGGIVDLAHEMTRITMGVVAATLFGAQSFDRADELGRALTVALKWVDGSLSSPLLSVHMALSEVTDQLARHAPGPLGAMAKRIHGALRAPLLLPGRKSGELLEAVRALDGNVVAMIEARRAHPQDRMDLLTKLLLARDPDNGQAGGMTDQQLRDEANTLFVAGHETTANALAWAFYLLARNPQAKQRVQAEADSFGPEGPTTFAADALSYTTRVFKEVLRLYPPLVLLGRRSLEPFELAGRRFGGRTLLFVNTYGIHTSDRVWPEPHRFDPDRFAPQREATRHKSAWIPFGVGPRVCIGNHFALMEGPIVLSTLMRRARFEIDPTRLIEPDAIATLRPSGGVPAVVHRVVS